MPGEYSSSGGSAPPLDRIGSGGYLVKSFELDRDYPEALFYKGLLHFQQQDYAATVECLRLARLPLEIGLVAAAYARQGNRSQAEESVEELRRLAATQYVTPLAEALAATGLKDFDLAVERVDEAIDHKTNFVNLLAVEPFFHPLRSDHRFTRFLKRLNVAV